MPNIFRTAKSGSEWTVSELDSYKIKIVKNSESSFFSQSLKDIVLDEEIANFDFVTDDISTLHKPSRKLLELLDMATRSRQESAVDDFASRLLSAVDYDSKDRVIRTRYSIPLTMCGIDTSAETDVCIIKPESSTLLLLQEDKSAINGKDPEPQVIAEAIAAFQENNRIRDREDLDPIDRMILPCITMVGTFPRFYLVPVTEDLSSSVRNGTCPNCDTTVKRYIPTIPRRSSDSMKPVENRKKILQCFEAFKKFVDDIEKELERE